MTVTMSSEHSTSIWTISNFFKVMNASGREMERGCPIAARTHGEDR